MPIGLPRLAALLAALVLALVPLVGHAQARSVAWQRFDVDLDVRRDGSMAVVETQEIRFQGTYQQGFRLISTERTTGIADVTVSEVLNGREVAYTRGTAEAPNTYRVQRQSDGVQVDWW